VLAKICHEITFLKGVAKKKNRYSENATFKNTPSVPLYKGTERVFWSTEFVFLPRLTGMLFHDEFLQALETFVNVCHKKKFRFFLLFTELI
jgi:hypothetical protein